MPLASKLLARRIAVRARQAAPAATVVLLAAGAAQAQTTNPFGLQPGTEIALAPYIGDFDRDGDLDILAGAQSGAFVYYENMAASSSDDPVFGAPVIDPAGLDAPPNSPAGFPYIDANLTAVDGDCDGDLDLIVGFGEDLGGGVPKNGRLFYYENQTDASTNVLAFSLAPSSFETGLRNPAPTFGDLNGDGVLDLIVGDNVGNLIYYPGTGDGTTCAYTGTFGAFQTNPFGIIGNNGFSGRQFAQPALFDYDTDGDLDLFVGRNDGNFYYQENSPTDNGDGTETPAFGNEFVNPFGLMDVSFRAAPAFRNLSSMATGSFAPGVTDALIGAGTGDFIYFEDFTGPLPVEFVAFDAVLEGDRAVLRWETTSETSNAGFEVQRLVGSEGLYEVVGFVQGAGDSSEARRYSFTTEALLAGTHRFRLRQVDFDGAFEYSPEVEVVVAVEGAFAFAAPFPNPTSGATTVSLAVAQEQHVTVAVFDALGRRVALLHEGTFPAGQAVALTLDADALPAGTYLVRATGATFATTRRLTVAD